MKIREYKQSATSPLKYHIELTPEEMECLNDKRLRVDILKRILVDAKTFKHKEYNK